MSQAPAFENGDAAKSCALERPSTAQAVDSGADYDRVKVALHLTPKILCFLLSKSLPWPGGVIPIRLLIPAYLTRRKP